MIKSGVTTREKNGINPLKALHKIILIVFLSLYIIMIYNNMELIFDKEIWFLMFCIPYLYLNINFYNNRKNIDGIIRYMEIYFNYVKTNIKNYISAQTGERFCKFNSFFYTS